MREQSPGGAFDEIFELVPEGIFITTLDGRCLAVNHSACELLSCSAHDMIGKSIADLLHPDQRSRFAEVRESLLRGGTNVGEWLARTRDGSYIRVELHTTISRDGKCVVFARDIQERRRAEEELARHESNEHELRLLADAGELLGALDMEWKALLARITPLALRLPADFVALDMVDEYDNIVRLDVMHVDPAKADICARLRTYPLDRNRPHLALRVLASREPEMLPHVTATDIDNIAQTAEHRALIASLEPRSMLAVPMISRGTVLGAYVFGASHRTFDSTDLRIARSLADRVAIAVDNARLHRAHQRAIQARDQVLAVVAHDLRNPLNSVTLLTDVLARQVTAPPGTHLVDRIRRAAQRANHLVQDLVDVVRLDAGKPLTLLPEDLTPEAIAAEALEEVEPIASLANVKLALACDRDLPAIHADRQRLLQIFDNLLGNAVKFSPHGSTITLRVSRASGAVKFSVCDQGPGIPRDQQDRVFDRYWQAQRIDRRGIGLGLYVVKGIVEAHRGRIWLDSESGRGTSFHFELPVT